MADSVKAVEKQTVAVVTKPVNAWRRAIARAGAVVEKPWRRYRSTVFLTYLIVAVVVFIVLAVLAKTIAYFTFDVTITRALQTFHAGWFDALMGALSWIGFSPQAWVIAAVIMVFLYASGLKWETVVILISVLGSSALGLGLKILVDRPRPSADLVNVISQLKSYSFPSGHVLFFVTFFGFLLFLAYTLLKPAWWRILLLVILAGMVALIGPSLSMKGSIGPAM